MRSPSPHSSRPVAIWVLTGVIMLLIQVILGGITRLTGSGLSITEWNVVTGTLPPLNSIQWQAAFDKYRQTPQFQILNSGFSLTDFKFIFFWEWFHRFWARMVGVVFMVGFAWLLWKKKMQPGMIRPLLILFLLGALQGAIGWIMVASGLTGDAIYVQPTRLALHFVFALVLVVYAFWFALQLSVSPRAVMQGSAGLPAGQPGSIGQRAGGQPGSIGQPQAGNRPMPQPLGAAQLPGTDRQEPETTRIKANAVRHWTIAILIVLFFQLLYGALMAGHKAANVAPTWPTINGDWVPDAAFSGHPLLQDLVGNRITVQFIHRGIAYLLLVMVVIWTGRALALRVPKGPFHRLRWLPLSLIGVQIALGIASLLTSTGIIPQHWGSFDWLAQFHQVTGLLFLLTMVGMLYLVKPDSVTV
jgi:heme a synthase